MKWEAKAADGVEGAQTFYFAFGAVMEFSGDAASRREIIIESNLVANSKTAPRVTWSAEHDKMCFDAKIMWFNDDESECWKWSEKREIVAESARLEWWEDSQVA